MIIARIVAKPEPVSPKTSAPTTAESATVDPTDRSMPRVRMTSSWPDREDRDRGALGEHVAEVAAG